MTARQLREQNRDCETYNRLKNETARQLGIKIETKRRTEPLKKKPDRETASYKNRTARRT